MKTPVLFILGTRPEAIKLAPVICAFRACRTFTTSVCVTAQHREMLDQCLQVFGIQPEFDLNLMSPNQSLPALTSKAVAGCAGVFEKARPAMVFVQGDTTTALCGALAASLCKIPVAHVEAGLRSHRRDSPFPEELNRTLISKVTDLHFAPSTLAAENLRREGIVRGVHVVGNTIVDALAQMLAAADRAAPADRADARKTILVTIHRRESFGGPLVSICNAIRRIAVGHPEVDMVYPVHPNPNVRRAVHESLSGIANLHLLEPLSYVNFVHVLSQATFVLTDSGGVLEEAETLGLPVLIAREVTERMEAVSGGQARLVGCDEESIVAEAGKLLASGASRRRPGQSLRTTFGDGHSSERILRFTQEFLAGTWIKTVESAPEALLARAQ